MLMLVLTWIRRVIDSGMDVDVAGYRSGGGVSWEPGDFFLSSEGIGD